MKNIGDKLNFFKKDVKLGLNIGNELYPNELVISVSKKTFQTIYREKDIETYSKNTYIWQKKKSKYKLKKMKIITKKNYERMFEALK